MLWKRAWVYSLGDVGSNPTHQMGWQKFLTRSLNPPSFHFLIYTRELMLKLALHTVVHQLMKDGTPVLWRPHTTSFQRVKISTSASGNRENLPVPQIANSPDVSHLFKIHGRWIWREDFFGEMWRIAMWLYTNHYQIMWWGRSQI